MKVAGHAIHPILVVFPLGLLSTSVAFDVVGLGSHQGGWHVIAYWMIAAGLLGGLAAAAFGVLDFIGIPEKTRARSVGIWHGVANSVVLVLFAISWFARRPDPAIPGALALVPAFVGVVVAVVGGWLGGELVQRLGMGVDEGAHPNAPSSLSGRPASDKRRDRRAA